MLTLFVAVSILVTRWVTSGSTVAWFCITYSLMETNIYSAPPIRTDGGDPEIEESLSSWSQTLYMCATATRARVIKTDFTYDGSNCLSNLQVEKNAHQVPMPQLWAIEKVNKSSRPLWGIVDDRFLNAPEVETFRGNHIWLPATFDVFFA